MNFIKPIMILKLLKVMLVFIFVTWLYSLQRHISRRPYEYFIAWNFTQVISCHYETHEDFLTSAEDLIPPENSIFFHETSCRGGLNSREACSIESAARKHPNHHIYVFFSSSVSEVVFYKSCLARLTALKNVHVARLHIMKYAEGTPLYNILASKENNGSYWPIENTADILRFITIYKYGGLYLDTDMLVAKPLDALGKNWVAKESDTLVNVAVLAVSKNGIGHELISQILDEYKFDYRPKLWGYNGPGAMTRALFRLCNTTHVPSLNADICHGFKVLDPSLVYPIHWTKAGDYFKFQACVPDTSQAFTHHLWNKKTRNTPVEPGSLYDLLAQKHCPTIRDMYNNKYITMYIYGGKYLDTDVLVAKPLDALGKNWVAKEDDTLVNIAALAVSKDGIGHELVSQILDEVKLDYRPKLWTHNGPGAMTRALFKLCNTSRVPCLNADICHGFKVLDPSLVYPIHWNKAGDYFEFQAVVPNTSQAFTHHLWNKMTQDTPVEPGSLYDLLAQKHCPTIRDMYGVYFGS